MSNLQKLQNLLKHKDNNPLEVIKVKFKEEDWHTKKMKRRKCEITHYVNIYYCCFTGGHDKGSIEEREELLMKTFDDRKSCILIFLRFDTLKKFKNAFSREMHWINQTHGRQERWKEIAPKMFKKIKANVEKVKDLEAYIEKHFESFEKILPVSAAQIYLESMTKSEVLDAIEKGEVTAKEAMPLIEKLDAEEAERNREKLCPFSGSGSNPDRPTRICSRTGDPKRLGDCGSCRVAADWEMAYG